MKALLFFIIIILNINIALGQNDTLIKKRAFYIGVNISKINLLNEYHLGNGTEYSGRWQNINGSVSSEFEGFLRSNFYKPTASSRDSIVLIILKDEWNQSVKSKLLKSIIC